MVARGSHSWFEATTVFIAWAGAARETAYSVQATHETVFYPARIARSHHVRGWTVTRTIPTCEDNPEFAKFNPSWIDAAEAERACGAGKTCGGFRRRPRARTAAAGREAGVSGFGCWWARVSNWAIPPVFAGSARGPQGCVCLGTLIPLRLRSAAVRTGR